MPVSILHEPIFSVRAGLARGTVSLPELLSLLSRGADIECMALQAHQRHAWHAFLVQTAALALRAAGTARVAQSREAWTAVLLTLTDGHIDPWCLAVSDLSAPALLQPPVPEGSLEGFRGATDFPDDIDVMITSKNHDVKTSRIAHPRPEHWVYALVSLQTCGAYLGPGNYGISRMNGGSGSRVCFAIASSFSPGARFVRDVTVWLEEWDRLVKEYGYAPDGRGLLWLEPWDGTESLALADCAPAYVEVCRRVRLAWDGGRLIAHSRPTKVARLDAADRNGDTGDIWTPVESEGRKALSLSPHGWPAHRAAQILACDGWRPGAAARCREDDGARPVLICEGFSREPGKTHGFHERVFELW